MPAGFTPDEFHLGSGKPQIIRQQFKDGRVGCRIHRRRSDPYLPLRPGEFAQLVARCTGLGFDRKNESVDRFAEERRGWRCGLGVLGAVTRHGPMRMAA